MASSTKFSEKFSLPSLTQQHKLSREKVSLLLLRFQAIILLIKLIKIGFWKRKEFPFRNLFYISFKLTGEVHKRKKENEMDDTI
jgi:hypothetical protein